MVHEKTVIWCYCDKCGAKIFLELHFKEKRVLEIIKKYHVKIPISAKQRSQEAEEQAKKLSEKLREKNE